MPRPRVGSQRHRNDLGNLVGGSRGVQDVEKLRAALAFSPGPLHVREQLLNGLVGLEGSMSGSLLEVGCLRLRVVVQTHGAKRWKVFTEQGVTPDPVLKMRTAVVAENRLETNPQVSICH